MAIYKVKAPDGHTYKIEGPDDATPEQIEKFAAENIELDPAGYAAQQSNTSMQNFLAGVGGSMKGLGLGVGQRLGAVDQKTIDEHKRLMAGLGTTKAGTAGEIAGLAVPAIATAAIPGANTYAGSALIGGAFGAAMPTSEDESPLKNVAYGVGGSVLGKYAGDKIFQYATNKIASARQAAAVRQAQNTVKDTTAANVQKAGYKLAPSDVGKKSVAESVSGKYKTRQAFGIENQKVTDSLAKRAVGLSDDAELTPERLQAIRNKWFADGYEPVRKAGQIKVDNAYLDDMQKIIQEYEGASKSFPDAAQSDVTKIVDNLLTDQFDAADAVDMVKILRTRAKDAFRKGENAIGFANKKAAGAIEDQIERALPNGDVLNGFKKARVEIAKTHTVEDALEISTGRVDARKIGRALEKGMPLSGDLRTVGQAGSAFPKMTKLPESGDANPFTVFDYFTGMTTAPLGAIAMGHPLGALTSVIAPTARIGSREYLKRAGPLTPSYAPDMVSRIVGGLLGNEPARAAIQGGVLTGGLLAQ